MGRKAKYIFGAEKEIIYKNRIHFVHQLIAADDFECQGRKVHAGDTGGWVEHETTLRKRGTCWIFPGIIVIGNSSVSGDACICNPEEMKNPGSTKEVVLEKVIMTDSASAEFDDADGYYLEMHKEAHLQIKGSAFMRISMDDEADAKFTAKKSPGTIRVNRFNCFGKSKVYMTNPKLLGVIVRGTSIITGWMAMSNSHILSSIITTQNYFVQEGDAVICPLNIAYSRLESCILCVPDLDGKQASAVITSKLVDTRAEKYFHLRKTELNGLLVRGAHTLTKCKMTGPIELLSSSHAREDRQIIRVQNWEANTRTVIQDGIIMTGEIKEIEPSA